MPEKLSPVEFLSSCKCLLQSSRCFVSTPIFFWVGGRQKDGFEPKRACFGGAEVEKYASHFRNCFGFPKKHISFPCVA